VADLQKQFEKFYDAIRVDFDSLALLREKRDIVLDKISKSLKDAEHPSFERLLQGSYKMKTGVLPLSGEEFDIDVGLVFSFDEKLPEASDPRQWVYDAIKKHTDKVVEKTPCVRVHYKDAPAYHLDLVVYGKVGEGALNLAKADGWVSADPAKLLAHVEAIQDRFNDTEGGTSIDQFRRVVRYLKRWGDVRLPGEAKEKPTGLAYTLLAGDALARTVAFDGTPDDSLALSKLARHASTCSRISARKPTPEYEDMFGRLSNDQMQVLKVDFGKLADAIDSARKEPDPYEACTALAAVLGEDFPVPPKGSGGKRTSSPAIVPSSSSAIIR
jgi:hypothetical protein